MPRRPDLPCADCGKLMWSSAGSAPIGKARCRPCRKARPIRVARTPQPYQKKSAYEWDCIVCGVHVVGTPRSHTGKKCDEHRSWKPRQCQTCDATFYTRWKARAYYCSEACGTQPEPLATWTNLRWRQCQCGKWICRPNNRQWCSNECYLHSEVARRGRPALDAPPPIPIKPCADCGSSTGSRRRTYCLPCSTIRRQASEQRARRVRRQRYGNTSRARARRYGVEYEPVDRIAVYNRDGWRCGICGLTVDKRLSAPHPMAASLDHVIPISLGGPHLYTNVQWGCG